MKRPSERSVLICPVHINWPGNDRNVRESRRVAIPIYEADRANRAQPAAAGHVVRVEPGHVRQTSVLPPCAAATDATAIPPRVAPI